MTTSVQLRPFQQADGPAVARLWNHVFGAARDHNEPTRVIQEKVSANDGLFFCAEDDGRIVGTVMAGYDGHRGWIYTLAVDRDYRRTGTGSRLMARAEWELQRRGCLKINLQVRAGQDDAVAFYRALGFEVEERVSMGKRVEPENRTQ